VRWSRTKAGVSAGGGEGASGLDAAQGHATVFGGEDDPGGPGGRWVLSQPPICLRNSQDLWIGVSCDLLITAL
jgi:hypothetical protein